jgi:alanine transaminase
MSTLHKCLRPLLVQAHSKIKPLTTLKAHHSPYLSHIILRPYTTHLSKMPVLTLDSINPHVRTAQYAVRGLIPQRAEQYRAQIAKGEGKDLPFDDIIFANIGNPQQLDQKPITFFRQVTSLLEYPPLLESEDVLLGKLGYKKDAVERARRLLKEVKSVGAYSNSAGVPGVKKSVAEFIEREYTSFS